VYWGFQKFGNNDAFYVIKQSICKGSKRKEPEMRIDTVGDRICAEVLKLRAQGANHALE